MPVKRMLSLRFKLLISLMALISVIFGLSYYGIKQYLRTTINGIMQEQTQTIIDAVTYCLDEDVLQALTTGPIDYDKSAGWPQGMTDPRYWEQQKCLEDIDTFNSSSEVFTYSVVDENTLAYGLDQYATLVPEQSYPFGDTFTLIDDDDFPKFKLGLQKTYYYDELTLFEETGIYYFGANAPMKNSAGEVIGGMTVYINASLMTEKLNKLSNILYAWFAAIYLVVGALILFITRTSTSQLSALQTAAARVAEGNYTPITLKPQTIGDEVTALTELFNDMLEKVRDREETLQSQVEDMKIIINVEERDRDVKAIKESEYFKDIKARAAEIRKQKEALKKQG